MRSEEGFEAKRWDSVREIHWALFPNIRNITESMKVLILKCKKEK